MAELGGVPLSVDARAGASFALAKASPDSWCQPLEDGTEVEVRAGSKLVVVRGGLWSSQESAFENSLSACQKGLDLIAMVRGVPLSIERVGDSHFTWWRESGRVFARLVGFAPLLVDVPPASLVITQPDGSKVTGAPILKKWDESFRFYRLSQVTDDIADAYRNMFLMLESVLSDIRPQRPGEGENPWLKAALQEAHNRYDLSSYSVLRPGFEGLDLHQDFAVDARHQINHAKRQRAGALPLDMHTRTKLAEKLGRLGSLCIKLTEKHLGARRSQSGMFASAFRRLFALQDTRLVITDERRAFDPNARTLPISPTAGIVRLMPQSCADYEDSYRVAVWSEIEAKDLAPLTTIARVIIAKLDDSPISGNYLDDVFAIEGIDVLQIVSGIYMTNLRTNRRDYAL